MRRLFLFPCLSLISASPAQAPPAGEGVLCAMAIMNVVDQVGKRCLPGQDPAWQAELARTVERIDTYVLENSPDGPKFVALFKREQGMVGAPAEQLCKGDPVSMYRTMAQQGPQALRTAIDRLLARPGPPAWGDCL